MTGTAVEQLRAVLAEHYTLERELGRGGMANVYLAQDAKHSRPLALKVLRPDVTEAGTANLSIASELQKSASLDSPSIVTDCSLPFLIRYFTVIETTPASSCFMMVPPVSFRVGAPASSHIQGSFSVKLASW